MPTRTQTKGRPGHDRQSVIRTAVEAFNEVGYDAMSMSALASRMGVTKSAIYHHVASKSDILQEATDRALDTLEQVTSTCKDCEGTAAEQLKNLIHGTTIALCTEAPYVTLLLRLRGNSEVELNALERRRKYTTFLNDLVQQCQQEGSVRADLDTHTVARLLFGMVNSLVEWYEPEGRLSAEEIAEITTTIAFDGISTQHPS